MQKLVLLAVAVIIIGVLYAIYSLWETWKETSDLKSKTPKVFTISCPFCCHKFKINAYAWEAECPCCKNAVIKRNRLYKLPFYIEKDGKEEYIISGCFGWTPYAMRACHLDDYFWRER